MKRNLIGLAGSHTWNTVQPFNGKTAKLDQLTGNFTRLWTIETRGMVLQGSAWGSNSPGLVRVGDVPWKRDGSLNGGFYRRLERAMKGDANAAKQFLHEAGFTDKQGQWLPQYQPIDNELESNNLPLT